MQICMFIIWPSKIYKKNVRALRQIAPKGFGVTPLRPDDIIVIPISFNIYQMLNT